MSYDDLYSQLASAIGSADSIRHRYRRMNAILRQTLEAVLPDGGLRFGGTFAQTEYILRQHEATPSQAHRIHGARVRMSGYGREKSDELQIHFLADAGALAELIHLATGQTPPPGLPVAGDVPVQRDDNGVTAMAERLRIVVTRVEPPYLYGHADGPSGNDVCVYLSKSNVAAYPDWDWAYCAELVGTGSQVNVIRPRTKNGIIYPELLIVEPDYLVDVTAVASCFEEYGRSPLTRLVGQLAPYVTTQPMLLGNMSGQLLDEELTLPPAERQYAKSARRFFQANALSVAATPLNDTFHADARTQQANIHRAICEGLQAHVAGFDPGQVVLEPSFFSEMLGLQGRLDFLSMDFSILIEQKSGRCGFPQRDPDTPVQAEKHYVQMLLYMLILRYNYRDVTARSGHRLLAFLLYSKYANSLLTLGFAPQLVAAAVRVRNEIAAAEFRYVREGFDCLSTLTADDLNTCHTHSPLWTRYQRPQLEAVLRPIREASPTARAYFLRMLRFEHTEHLLAKVGDRTSTSHGFAEKWQCSLAEKLEAGSIAAPMTLVPPPDGESVSQLRFRLPPLTDDAASNFRVGDIVIVYAYDEDTEPDACHAIAFRATITQLTTDETTLRLRAPQTNNHVFAPLAGKPWAMEADFMEASFATIYRGLHAMLTAPEERRRLLLLQRPPKVDATQQLRGDYGTFNAMALRVRQASELFLIIGPPGTGKTSFGLMTTLRETLLGSPEAAALLVAFTNRAVDEICSKLHEAHIDFVRLGNAHTAEAWMQPYLLDTRVAAARDVASVRDIILHTRIVVATTSAIASQSAFLAMRRFDVAIVDEASQILEPQLLPLWCAVTSDGQPSVAKFVLIGDHCQLAAVVQQPQTLSAVEEPLLHDILLTDCRDSLFERLLRRYRHDPAVCYMLTRQGRMHPDIAAFPSMAFYGGQLLPVPLPHQLRQLPADMPPRVEFVDVQPRSGISDKVNEAEADVIARLVLDTWHDSTDFDPAQTLGVIVPYRNQIAAIRQRLSAYCIPQLDALCIDTVERYQGSQRDTIIYGFTISHEHQLRFLASTSFDDGGHTVDRKLNVAMTRAREKLVLVGYARLLRHQPVFASLLDFITNHKT